jgi:hypothetical protein
MTFSLPEKWLKSRTEETHFHHRRPHKTEQNRFCCHPIIMATNCITATHAAAIVNPHSHAATQPPNEQLEFMQQRESSQATNQAAVATDMGVQSQQRMKAVKKCKKMGAKRLTKHALRQHPVDAGRVALVAIENCVICKAKHLRARGINARIPKRAHHKACP